MTANVDEVSSLTEKMMAAAETKLPRFRVSESSTASGMTELRTL